MRGFTTMIIPLWGYLAGKVYHPCEDSRPRPRWVPRSIERLALAAWDRRGNLTKYGHLTARSSCCIVSI